MSFLTIVVILISGICMLVVSYGFKKNWEKLQNSWVFNFTHTKYSLWSSIKLSGFFCR